MIGIEEITKYKTSDGMEFEEEEEEAITHEIALAIKQVNSNDIVVKDRVGETIDLTNFWRSISSAYYVEVKSEAALDFFNEASRTEGIVGLPFQGIFRYDEMSDEWVTPYNDVQEVCERWKIFNHNINFSVTNS